MGNVQCIDDMAGIELLLGAHVQHHAFVTVDQRSQFAIAQALATLLRFGDGEQLVVGSWERTVGN